LAAGGVMSRFDSQPLDDVGFDRGGDDGGAQAAVAWRRRGADGAGVWRGRLGGAAAAARTTATPADPGRGDRADRQPSRRPARQPSPRRSGWQSGQRWEAPPCHRRRRLTPPGRLEPVEADERAGQQHEREPPPRIPVPPHLQSIGRLSWEDAFGVSVDQAPPSGRAARLEVDGDGGSTGAQGDRRGQGSGRGHRR